MTAPEELAPRSTTDLWAANADRRGAVADLQAHFVAGRLSADELGTRITRALSAQTLGELEALQRDLPGRLGPAAAAPPQPSRLQGITSRRDLRAHLASYVSVMVLLVAIWLLTTPGGYFWPVWPMLGWGIGVFKHVLFAMVVATPRGCGATPARSLAAHTAPGTL